MVVIWYSRIGFNCQIRHSKTMYIIGISSNGKVQDAVGMDTRFNFYQKQSFYATDVRCELWPTNWFGFGFCPINEQIYNCATNKQWAQVCSDIICSNQQPQVLLQKDQPGTEIGFLEALSVPGSSYYIIAVVAVFDKKSCQFLMKSDIWA